jgi:WD repeat and SOF domain-containing protein 1
VSRYNPAQSNILASAASDRSIALYDTRLQTPVRKIVLQMASNGHNLPRLVR